MQKQPFILLIMNCFKYKEKAMLQKETWLRNIPAFLKYFHVIGNPLLINEYDLNEETNTLTVRVNDDYNSLPKKVIAAYQAIAQQYDFQYLFKTDDDQDVLNPQFFEMVKRLIDRSSPHYGGYIVDVKQPYYSKYHRIHAELPENLPILPTKYCSGRFYFLSFMAIINLIQKKTEIQREYLEDYAIGFYLSPEFKTNMLHIQTDRFLIDFK